MNEGNNLIGIDAGDLAQPATTLVEKIFEAIGVWYEPTRLVKEAEARAHVALIEFNSKSTLSELQRRSLANFVKKEEKRQRNIDSIISNAISSLEPDSQPQNIEDDWLGQFFKLCDHVSDEGMQKVWGDILARKAENPGSYSKKTLSILALLESNQAEMFVKLCSAAIQVEDIADTMIYEFNDELCNSIGISLSNVLVLQYLGLVTYSPYGLNVAVDVNHEKVSIDNKFYLEIHANYFNKKLKIYSPFSLDSSGKIEAPRLQIGKVNLTIAGREILSICNPLPHELFLPRFEAELAKSGMLVKPWDQNPS